MNKKIYDENLKNKEITDCVVIGLNTIAFAIKSFQTKENDPDDSISENRTTSILVYAPKLVNVDNGFVKTIEYFKGIDQFKVTYNEKLIVISTSDFRVEEKEDDDLCNVISDDFYMREVTSIKTIDGVTYATGLFHKVYMRTGIHSWVDITVPDENTNLFLDLKRRREAKGNIGGANASFYKLDGFSSNDLYAGGDNGDLWRYDGKIWKVIDLPVNFDIRAITCAGDGYVYVSGHNSYGILKGRENVWEIISKSENLLHINDTTWFNDRLYLSDDYTLYRLENDEIKVFRFPQSGPQQHSFARVTSCEDALVAYGGSQALVFDGKICKEIIGIPEVDQSGL